MGRDGCTVCGATFEHNACLFGGCDGYGRAVVVGDCCSEHLALVTHMGLYAARSYDFLHPRKREPDPHRNRPADVGEITNAIAACRDWIEEADKQADGMERRAGLGDRDRRSMYWRAPGKPTIACGSKKPGAIAPRAARVPR